MARSGGERGGEGGGVAGRSVDADTASRSLLPVPPLELFFFPSLRPVDTDASPNLVAAPAAPFAALEMNDLPRAALLAALSASCFASRAARLVR